MTWIDLQNIILLEENGKYITQFVGIMHSH